MASTDYRRRGPNRLLQGMILVSLGIHMLIFMHITGLYRSKALHYIELTLKDEKKTSSRAIPRPPQLLKADEKSSKAKATQMSPIQLPDVDHMKMAPGDGIFSASLIEGVRGVLLTKEDYIEMVRFRIDREKMNYWFKEADGTYKNGLVSISFVINPDGTISNLRIEKPSPYKSLNQAALQTVRKSVPFPNPPPTLFKGGVVIRLTLTFDLIETP